MSCMEGEVGWEFVVLMSFNTNTTASACCSCVQWQFVCTNTHLVQKMALGERRRPAVAPLCNWGHRTMLGGLNTCLYKHTSCTKQHTVWLKGHEEFMSPKTYRFWMRETRRCCEECWQLQSDPTGRGWCPALFAMDKRECWKLTQFVWGSMLVLRERPNGRIYDGSHDKQCLGIHETLEWTRQAGVMRDQNRFDQ